MKSKLQHLCIALALALQALGQTPELVNSTQLESGLGLKVDLTALSTTGGVNKVLQMDASGNLYTGPLDNRIYDGVLGNASTGYRVNGFGTVGNIYMPDQQGLVWRDPATGAAIFNIRHWRGHDAVYGEAIIESAWRIALLGQGPIQFGHNETNRTSQCLHMVSGPATAGDPVKHSKAITQQAFRHNGGVGTVGYSIIQTTSLNDGPDDTVWRLNLVEGSSATVVPVEGFNGFAAGVTTTGVANGTTVLQASMTGITTPGVDITSGSLVFADDTSLSSTDDIADMIAAQTAPRTGYVALVAGEATVVDASVTGYTQILVSHKSAGGTLGHLSIVKDLGVGFDVVSSSATDTSTVSYLLVEGTQSDVAAPTISGTNEITDVLTVSGGSGGRQWYANDVLISGETGATYAIGAAYIGQAISCYVGGVESNTITAWHPDDETGYFADFRADAGTFQSDGGSAATADADPVGEWEDQSGNGRHMIQATAAQKPQMATTDGYRNIFFDDDATNGDYLYRVTLMGTMAVPQTTFVVGSRVSASLGNRFFTTTSSGQRANIGSNNANQLYNGVTNTAIVSGWTANTRGLITARTTGTNSYCSLNGGAEASASNTNLAGGYFYAGGFGPTVTMECRINAILFYNADLDASAQARVRKWLKAKWGTP